ncbi:MAG: molybdenum cofactor guanylyltransferase [Cellvibrionaceae bacterium]
MQNNTLNNSLKHSSSTIPAIILAGGQSQRLRLEGQYKWQLPFNNKQNLLQYIINKISKQSDKVLINGPFIKEGILRNTADGENSKETDDLSQYSLPLIHDKFPDFQGPLAGLFTALKWAKDNSHPWVMTLACDSPFFPDDLLKQLYVALRLNHEANCSTEKNLGNEIKKKQAIVASSHGRMHPIFGIWSTTLLTPLENKLNAPSKEKRSRSITQWAHQYAEVIDIKLTKIDSKSNESYKSHSNSHDAFFNINTIEDYHQAQSIIRAL